MKTLSGRESGVCGLKAKTLVSGLDRKPGLVSEYPWASDTQWAVVSPPLARTGMLMARNRVWHCVYNCSIKKDLGLIPNTTMVAHNLNSSHRGPDELFWPLEAPGVHIVHRQNTPITDRKIRKHQWGGGQKASSLGKSLPPKSDYLLFTPRIHIKGRMWHTSMTSTFLWRDWRMSRENIWKIIAQLVWRREGSSSNKRDLAS